MHNNTDINFNLKLSVLLFVLLTVIFATFFLSRHYEHLISDPKIIMDKLSYEEDNRTAEDNALARRINALTTQSLSAYKSNNLDLAETLVKQLLSLDSYNLDGLSLYARICTLHGNWAEADKVLRFMMHYYGENPILRNELGIINLKLQNGEQALKDFAIVQKIMPQMPYLDINIARAFALLKDTKHATLFLQQSFDLHPDATHSQDRKIDQNGSRISPLFNHNTLREL